MELHNDVWLWLILGVVFVAAEVFTGTFHLLFLGGSGLLVAALTYLWAPSLTVQIGVFAVLSILSVLIVQKKFGRNRSSGFEADVHQLVTISEPIAAGREGVVQYQGSPWTAVNSSNQDLLAGHQARVVRTEGVKLYLKLKE